VRPPAPSPTPPTPTFTRSQHSEPVEYSRLTFSVRGGQRGSGACTAVSPHVRIPRATPPQAMKPDGEGILVYLPEGDVGVEACKP
jgi:hypothetical protein